MHVGSADKTKRATAKIKLKAFLAHNLAIREIGAEISSHHLEGHLRSNNLRVRIAIHERNNASRMVGLHMMHHKVIRRAPIKSGFNVTQPFVNETSINRVSYRHLFADNNVAVVRHTVFANIVLPFKQIDIVIVYAYILDSFGYLHGYLRSPMIVIALLTVNDLAAMLALPMKSF